MITMYDYSVFNDLSLAKSFGNCENWKIIVNACAVIVILVLD